MSIIRVFLFSTNMILKSAITPNYRESLSKTVLFLKLGINITLQNLDVCKLAYMFINQFIHSPLLITAHIFSTIFLLSQMPISFVNLSHVTMLILNTYWHPCKCSRLFKYKHVEVCFHTNYIGEKYFNIELLEYTIDPKLEREILIYIDYLLDIDF